MNNDTFQGKWKQLRGNLKAAFGKLTDDDLLQIDGNTDHMQGLLQERYGYTKEQAQTEWRNFMQQQLDRIGNAKTDLDAAADHIKDIIKR